MVDTIAILYRGEDVDKYKKGDFRITSYRSGSPVCTLSAMGCADMQPAVYVAKSGKLLDYSINGNHLMLHIEFGCKIGSSRMPSRDDTGNIEMLGTDGFVSFRWHDNSCKSRKCKGLWWPCIPRRHPERQD